MPTIKTITPLLPGKYYHIFNRGSNRKKIYYSEENYRYFLRLVDRYLSGYIDILSYCLLPNHFHMVIRVKDYDEIKIHSDEYLNTTVNNAESLSKIIANQFKRLFITFAMAINKQENIVGNLFDPKYKRLEIEDDDYLKYLIFYTHYNPEKHGMIKSFKDYRYSSFKVFSSSQHTKVNREHILDIFGGLENFLNYHDVVHDERQNLILE